MHAVDISQSMLTYAHQKAIASSVDQQIQFHHQGFLTYEHRASPGDFVVTQSALHHLPDFWKMVALLRIATMLKSGGILYLWDTIFSFPPSEYHTHINAWIQRAGKPAGKGWTIQDFKTHVRGEYTTFTWIIEQMLEEAGFSIEAANHPTAEIAEYTCRKTATTPTN